MLYRIVLYCMCLFFFQAEQYIGMAMTFSLFEFAKENGSDLLAQQPESVQIQVGDFIFQ